MAYTMIDGIRIYALSGGLSGTYPLPEDPIWTGSLCFPHAENIFGWSAGTNSEYVVIANGSWIPQPTAYYTQLLQYCPDFDRINAVCNGPATYTSGTLTNLLPGLVLAWPGVSGARLHIVAKEGSDQAYAYTVDPDAPDVSGAVSAQIQADGSVTIGGTPLCMPRLSASRNMYRFYGCLIYNGLASDGSVGAVVDCKVYGLRIDPGYGIGLRTSLYLFDQPETYLSTAALLTDWLRSGFDHSSFIKGILTGQRLRLWHIGQGYESDDIVPAGTPGNATYDEQSFLSGMSVGFSLRGWPMYMGDIGNRRSD